MKIQFSVSHLRYILDQFWIRCHLHLIAGILFFGLTAATTWPLVTQLNSHVTPGQQPAMAVPYLNLWTLAWNHSWLGGQTSSYWNANLFYPHQKTLAYSEPQLGTSLLTAPIVFFGGNTILAYNVVLLGFIWGAGMVAYALCWWLLDTFDGNLTEPAVPRKDSRIYRWLSAVTTGILYGFNFYMFREIGVLQLLSVLFIPLTFLGIHRFFHQYRWLDVLVLSIGFLGAWYTCAYYGIFLSVFVPFFILRLGWRNLLDREVLIKGVVAGILICVSLMPLVYGMLSAKTVMNLDRAEYVVRDLSAVFTKYFQLPTQSWLYGDFLKIGTEQSLFLGGTLLCLAGLAVMVIYRTKRNEAGTINEKPQSLLHQYGGFYLFMALFALILSLGMALAPRPSTDLGVYQFLVWLSPYNLLYKFVPGFSSIRSPHRFYVFVCLFSSLLAGYGMFWLSQRVRPRWRHFLVPLLVVAAILELWPIPLRFVKVPRSMAELPSIYEDVRKLPSGSTLIELPIDMEGSERASEPEARSMYFGIFHQQSLVNGYSGFMPQAHLELGRILLESTPETAILGLKAFGIKYVLVHTDKLNASEKVQLSALEKRGLKLLSYEEKDSLYQVEPGNIEALETLPDIESVRIYESEKSDRQVTLCFTYQIEAPHCILTTPWQNQIECEVAWYEYSDPKKASIKPILMSQELYRGSKLITAPSNAVEIELPAPSPGEYRVVVRQHFGANVSETVLLCQIHSNGFVTCQGEI